MKGSQVMGIFVPSCSKKHEKLKNFHFSSFCIEGQLELGSTQILEMVRYIVV